ncbi:kinesin-like protein KIN-12C isoform X2 [Typha latifolia]|uniref:kinesin-like protein KIN-12C isoform X2 n=1 Tax=Typha latifolia TaxID=4733 RepID=UPI003C2E46B0
MEILRTLKPASRSLSPLHPTAGGAGRHMNSPQGSRSGRENTPPIHPNVQASSASLSKKPSATTPRKVDLLPKESTRSDEYPLDSSKKCSDPYIKVIVRARPVSSQGEKGNGCAVRKVSDDSLAVGDRTFTFNSVLGPESTQEDVFKLVGVPLVENSLAGFNTSIVSYGQTGSGKTYTMWGPPSAMVDSQFMDGRQGIVPRIFQLLFSEIQRKQENSEEKQINYQCRCSFLEIHNEHINDLLDPTQRNLQIRDDSRNGFHVENLTDEYVMTVEEVTQILIKGLSNRKIGATSMNSKSSRSHIIFTCIIESWCKSLLQGPSSSCFSSSKTSKISLVDLAGSDIDESDGLSKQCIKEGRHVKKSLSKLGKLVNILADVTNLGRDQKILYMDSCLTHLLQDMLGGNSKTTLICAISSNDRCKAGTLSTLRFGERAKNIQNKAVINEITEDDVNGLSDQIRQLKEELIRTKSYKGIPNGTNTGDYFKGHNARESLKVLRVSLNRSLILPRIDIESEEEIDVDEEDVKELCDQISILHSSSEDNLKDMLEDQVQLCDTSKESSKLERDEGTNLHIADGKESNIQSMQREDRLEEEHSEVSELTACSSIAASTKSSLLCGDASDDAKDNPLLGSPTKYSLSISPCQQLPVLQDPTLCSSPKFKKNVLSPGLLSVGKRSASGYSISNSIKDSPGKVDGVRSSLQSTKLSPTESLAASLHHGLQVIDYHQRNSASRMSIVGLSLDHLALNSCHSVEKVNSGIQTLPEEQRNVSSFLCSSCKKVVENEHNLISETSASNVLQKSSLKDNIVPTNASKREMELEALCAEQEARIKHLSSLVDQRKQGDCQNSTQGQSKDEEILCVASLTDGLATVKELRSEGTTSLEAEHATLLNDNSVKQSVASLSDPERDNNTSFDSSEREALLREIESLRNQLKCCATNSVKDDSLLDQIRNGVTPDIREEELEKERQRWTESESRWISLTEELRLDLESNRRLAEKKEMELNMEKNCTAELDDALHRAIHGHTMIVEHYVELQENYNDLLEKHRKVMEGIAEVKKAALKAGRKGSGSAFAAALSAELSTLRIDREKERACLKEQNRRLRIQLRDTAEAVHAAGELLVRLREAEAAVSQAEEKYAGAQQEIDRLRKLADKMKKKHAMEIITMKHYLAESRLPESALEPFYRNESEIAEDSKPQISDEDQSWRAAFGPAYR